MRISLIGMSGCGKTHWSKEFARNGYKRFCCDDLIAEKLASALTQPGGSVIELGQWMGFPYEPQYEDREKKYLSLEVEVLEDILTYLKNGQNNTDENIIVDTTGSVIYTGEARMESLRTTTTVVYLETPPHIRDVLLEKYIKNKRPVLWRKLFRQESDVTHDEALARCYPMLLASREQLYARYAHVTLDYQERTREGFGIEAFLKETVGNR